MNCRKNIAAAFAVTLGLCVFATLCVAQSPPMPIYLVHPVRDGVYWIEGGAGANSGFIVGDRGVIAIDVKTTVESEKLTLSELAKITTKPITHVILTHQDSDHVTGLPALPTGLTIIAQENCKKALDDAAARGDANALPKAYLPTQSVDKMESLTIDGVHVVLLHAAPAHTSGDLIVYLPDQKIAFTGDAYNSRLPGPYVHVAEGGSAVGWVEETRQIAGLNADLYITGHGTLVTQPEVQSSLEASEKELAQVKALIAQGKTLPEIQQALGETTPLKHADGRPLPFYSEFIYQELTKK
jgi:cyclase